jgi:hypothetical protein
MESHNPSWSWKEGLRFALCWEFLNKEGISHLPPSTKVEIFGSWIVSPLYKVLDRICHHLRKPLTIVLFTILTSLILGVIFYNIPAFIFLGRIVLAKALRFSLFIYIEIVLLGIGCKAFGRFQNHLLVELWKKGELTSIFPGGKTY